MLENQLEFYVRRHCTYVLVGVPRPIPFFDGWLSNKQCVVQGYVTGKFLDKNLAQDYATERML